jgi:hypothetical protein
MAKRPSKCISRWLLPQEQPLGMAWPISQSLEWPSHPLVFLGGLRRWWSSHQPQGTHMFRFRLKKKYCNLKLRKNTNNETTKGQGWGFFKESIPHQKKSVWRKVNMEAQSRGIGQTCPRDPDIRMMINGVDILENNSDQQMHWMRHVIMAEHLSNHANQAKNLSA